MQQVGLSQRRACHLVGIARSVVRYRSRRVDDAPLRTRLRELARERPRFGSPRLTALVRREFADVNHKRIERLYAEEKLQLPRRRKRLRGQAPRAPLPLPLAPMQRWSFDGNHL